MSSQNSTTSSRRKGAELASFFERLRQCVADRGMSQADLARELGLGVATVSEWFTRGRAPSGDVMLRIPGALSVNGHWLLTGEGPRDLERRRGMDPYLRGVQDALAELAGALETTARRFGAEGAARGISPARPAVTKRAKP